MAGVNYSRFKLKNSIFMNIAINEFIKRAAENFYIIKFEGEIWAY
ncbi:MAG TPA: hypothetical protein PLX37_00155 [Sedimentibacter sp.]|nr:hypothetical protein [Sedimentibacter sp.]HOH68849.1 hypothetical protein [Sedimentibacter sp.]